jgi:Cu-Zn family superoxide dismutase
MNRYLLRTVALLGSAAAALAISAVATAHPSAATSRVFTLTPSTHGNPEGVASDGRAFFVGATGDGTIYRGTLGSDTVEEFIPGAAGKSAIGLEIARGRLYVAGGATGAITVYDLHSRQQVASFATGAGGFLNDLVVTRGGDVFVTDSFRPTLWHVTAAQVRSGSGTPEAIAMDPEIVFAAGAFNLNGIVALDERTLVVVNSNDGGLFRIDLQRSGRKITKIDAPAVAGDGMILDRGLLVVVQGSAASLTFLDLDHRASRAKIVDVVTDPTLRGPSTIARLRDRYLVVNADFATSTTPFTVSGLPRGHGHGDHLDGDDLDDGDE